MKEKFSDIMTVAETADYLRIGKTTLYKMVRDGKIPAFKIGNQWRFKRDDIEKWLEKITEGGGKVEG